jgi:methyl-accepting chemotaxis protein
MNYFKRLTITQRFLASVCFFSLPLGVLFYFNIDQLAEKIAFARGEIAGNRFQRPAIRLVKALTDYQILAAENRSAEERSAQEKTVEGLIRQIETENHELAPTLRITDAGLHEVDMDNVRAAELAGKWSAVLTASQHSSPAEAAAKADQLIGDVRGLIGRVADTSNLTLDPEIDSYYLSDISSVAGVQTLNRIGSAQAAIIAALGKKRTLIADGPAVEVFAASLKESDMDRITGDAATALRENPKSSRGPSASLKSNLASSVAQYAADTQSLLNLLTAASRVSR